MSKGLFCDIELGLNIIRYVVWMHAYDSKCGSSTNVSSMCDEHGRSGDTIVLLGELVRAHDLSFVYRRCSMYLRVYWMRLTLQDHNKERDQPHMKRVELEEVLEAEERLNEEGTTSVRQQWDFEHQH